MFIAYSVNVCCLRSCNTFGFVSFSLPNFRIIAVSYEARAFGVTRNMWADDAKKLCPDLLLAQVRESRGKANLTK